MAKTRLALVAAKGAVEGPWTLAKGNESGLRIHRLTEGESIRLDLEVGELSESFVFDSTGDFPLPFKRVVRYRVCKISDGGLNSPTTVEMILHESTESISWEPSSIDSSPSN